jgi:DNA-directed RNA polymerase subunit RPC12/RpoP
MTSSTPKFCSNCGETLENLNDEEIKKCPKCKIDLIQIGRPTHNTPVVDQLPYKSPGTAALIAFIGGIFALLGLGHMYIGNVGRGIGILISGIIIYVLFIIIIIFSLSLQGLLFLGVDESPIGIEAILIIFVLGIAYFVLWIWQIFNARKLAKKFNESVRITGKEPW